jgi:hypothetical protein
VKKGGCLSRCELTTKLKVDRLPSPRMVDMFGFYLLDSENFRNGWSVSYTQSAQLYAIELYECHGWMGRKLSHKSRKTEKGNVCTVFPRTYF